MPTKKEKNQQGKCKVYEGIFRLIWIIKLLGMKLSITFLYPFFKKKNSFTVMKFIYHKICPFEMCKPLAFILFRIVYTSPQSNCRTFSSLLKGTRYPLAVIVHSPLPLWNINWIWPCRFLNTQFYFIHFMSILMPVPQCLILALYKFEIEKLHLMTWWGFKIILFILSPFHFYMNFRIIMSVSAKKLVGGFW